LFLLCESYGALSSWFFFFFFFQFSNIENSVSFFKKLAKLIEFTILKKTHLFPKNSQLFCRKNNQICRKIKIKITTPTYHAFLNYYRQFGTLLWNSIRLHRSVPNATLPPDCKRVGIRVWGTPSVFLRKNFVSLCVLLFSVALFFVGLSLQFRFVSVEFLLSESESDAYSSPPEGRDRGSERGKLNERFYFLGYGMRSGFETHRFILGL
jgi:hypothetical protein